MYKCVILVADPSLERVLIDYLSKFNSIEIIDILCDKISAFERLHYLKPDFIFIDVDDPNITGIELADFGNNIGVSIAVTQSRSEVSALLNKGYLDIFVREDLHLDNFCRKINKVLRFIHYFLEGMEKNPLEESEKSYKMPATEKDEMFVKHMKKSVKICYENVLYIRNINNVLTIFQTNGKIVCHNSTLKKFIKVLPPDLFVRINNSTIINFTKITEIMMNNINLEGVKFKVSKNYMENFKRVIGL